jgi:hypothetical protein
MVPMVYGMKCNLKLLELILQMERGLGGNLDLMVSGSAALQISAILPLQKFR